MELSTCCIRSKLKWNAILVCNDLHRCLWKFQKHCLDMYIPTTTALRTRC